MTEENNEQKEKEENKTESSTDNSGEGNKPSLTEQIAEANLAAERMEKATAELKAEQAKARLAGVTEAGKPTEKPTKLTDQEYAEALERGEVNPLKEDGFV